MTVARTDAPLGEVMRTIEQALRGPRLTRPAGRRVPAGAPAAPSRRPSRSADAGAAAAVFPKEGSPDHRRGLPRARRSCLAVPGSNPRFLEKAQGLPADQVFLDLEDACAPLAKPGAPRHREVPQPGRLEWQDPRRAGQRLDHEWTYRDVVTVVEGAGRTWTA